MENEDGNSELIVRMLFTMVFRGILLRGYVLMLIECRRGYHLQLPKCLGQRAQSLALFLQ